MASMFTADDIQARLRERPLIPPPTRDQFGAVVQFTHPHNRHAEQRESYADRDSQPVAILQVADLQDIPGSAPTETNGPSGERPIQ
jgi:hypothetical protein